MTAIPRISPSEWSVGDPPGRSSPPPVTSAPRSGSRQILLPTLAFILIAGAYIVLSVRQHHMLLTSGYDLGIFEQSVRSYASGHLPVSTLKGPGFELLGDHFSPIVALLAPFYLLFPGAQTLLVAQAVLLASGVVPLTRWALRSCGAGVAVLVASVFGLSWPLAEAIGFDFHEIAFAVPLLAWSLAALGQHKLRAALAFAAPLVLVKEDLGLTLAVIGALVAWRGERLLGSLAAVGGVLATVVEAYVIIPSFSSSAANPYTGQIHAGQGLWHLVDGLVTSDAKLSTLFLLLAPTAFLALRSPIVLVAVPTVLWRFTADNPAYWGTSYHYNAVLAPVMIAAMIDALSRIDARRRIMAGIAALAVSIALVHSHPLSRLLSDGLWNESPTVASAHRLLDRIPDGVTVSASNWLAPQLTGRDDVSLFGHTPLDTSHAEWVIVNTEEALSFPISHDEQGRQLQAALADGYHMVDSADGVYLLRRD